MSKLCKSKTLFGCLAVLFLLFLLPISLVGSDCQIVFDSPNTSSITNKDIEREIKSYLISNSFYPVLTNNEMKYEIEDILEESGVVYTLGFLSQDDTCILSLFSIEKGWFSTTTNMLYMTTDFPPTPLLFKDICSVAQNALPKALSNYHVLIQNLENPTSSNGYKSQIWAFYCLGEWIEFIVLTAPTLDGGTDFFVGQSKR